jgi:hypothetical protein
VVQLGRERNEPLTNRKGPVMELLKVVSTLDSVWRVERNTSTLSRMPKDTGVGVVVVSLFSVFIR